MNPPADAGDTDYKWQVESRSHPLTQVVLTQSVCGVLWAVSRQVDRSLAFEYRFSINRELYHVADDDAAFVHGVVPTDTKVLPINFCFSDEAGAGPGSFVHAVFPLGCLYERPGVKGN